jgi:predicted esterase
MIRRIWGVTLTMSDLQRAVEFYERVLASQKKYEFPAYAGFECAGTELGLNTWGGLQPPRIGEPYVDLLVDDIHESFATLTPVRGGLSVARGKQRRKGRYLMLLLTVGRMSNVLVLALVTVVGQIAQTEARQVRTPELKTALEVPYAADIKSIDGEIADWRDVLRYPVRQRWSAVDLPPGQDLAVAAAFAYDLDSFYTLLEVSDDHLEFPSRAWRYGDGFYLTFAEPTPAFRSNRYISLGLSLEGGRPRVVVVNRNGEYFPTEDVSGVRFMAVLDETARRIVYEVAIPWMLLRPLQPLVDEVWGLNLIYVDRDEGRREMVFLAPDGQYDTEETDIRVTRPIRFGAAPAELRAAQFRPHRAHVRANSTLPVSVGVTDARLFSGARVTWRIGGDVVSGSLSVKNESNARQFRFEIPVGDLPSKTLNVTLALVAGDGQMVRETTIPLLVLNQRRLAEIRAILEEAANCDDATGLLKTYLPSALIRLQRAEAFLAEAVPFADTTAVVEDLHELDLALKDVRAGRPVFAARRGVFRHAHRSALDATLQPYSVFIPADYNPLQEYPLLVALHGSGVDERQTVQTAAQLVAGLDWIVLAPRARGLSDWYQGNSGREVLECIADVRRRYSIDADRVVLYGFSMGGYGAWRLSLQNPGLFAGAVILSGALARGGEDLIPLLEKVHGVGFFVVHGTADNAISVDHARRAVAILRTRGYQSVEYLEIPGAAHGGYLKRIRSELRTWLQHCRRDGAG